MYNKLILLSIILGFTFPAIANVEVKAPQAYMVDLQTGDILLDKNADQQMAPSSMSKIMTVYFIFKLLKDGAIKLNDEFPVSENAWKTDGSKTFVKVNSKVSVDDLLNGVIVQSGNDACVVLAEGVAGSEAAFADELNKLAQEMGLKNSSFVNASGLPVEGHFSTAKDLALMAIRTIYDFPKEYERYAVKEFTYNNIKQGNRNTLLTKNMGVDGVKTGHSDVETGGGGYGIVASGKQGDRRLILVVNGLPSMNARDQEATTLMNYGFNFFKNYKVLEKGRVLDVADVWGGTEKKVELVPEKEFILTLPRIQFKDLKVKIAYEAPIPAPLKAGDKIGEIIITIPEKGVKKFPLTVAKDVTRAPFIERVRNSIHYLLYGKYGS